MATSQPTNRDITADTAIDPSPGSTFLGVTPEKRVALFKLPDIDSATGALRFNQVQDLSDEERRLVLQNIGRDKIIQFLLPGGGLPGQAVFVDSTGVGLVARTLTGGSTTPTVPTGDYAVAIAAANASASNMRTKTAQLQS